MRWKSFNAFAAYLFGKLCTKFHQNRPGFIKDNYKKITLVSGHSV